MKNITIYEFDFLVSDEDEDSFAMDDKRSHVVPSQVFAWLEQQAFRASAQESAVWIRLAQRARRRALQVTSFVGVVRAPDGFQIEVLPKVGRARSGGEDEARELLIEMLCALPAFRHVKTAQAKLRARRLPLLEIFIAEFLAAVEGVVKRGLRSAYSTKEANLSALRGKLLTSMHLRQNLCRADRFFTEHDEFSTDRPENRILHAALRRVLLLSRSQANQRLARELTFVFAELPLLSHPREDFQQVRLDREMGYYADALAWSRLILEEESPLTGSGCAKSPSLLFPMEAVFEAFVATHLPSQLTPSYLLRTQTRKHHLVRHREQDWFVLKPDLLVASPHRNELVLDTKWKILETQTASRTSKYGLSQQDLYQMHAYGHTYLDGAGDVILIYPRTDTFPEALPVFEFSGVPQMRLWVLPFCLKDRRLLLPEGWSNGFFKEKT
jgi:5-methylcytosine-specific restriction enzyme subunit McrC